LNHYGLLTYIQYCAILASGRLERWGHNRVRKCPMRNNSKYRPRIDLDEENRIGWVGYIFIALVILFSAGITERIADYIKII